MTSEACSDTEPQEHLMARCTHGTYSMHPEPGEHVYRCSLCPHTWTVAVPGASRAPVEFPPDDPEFD